MSDPTDFDDFANQPAPVFQISINGNPYRETADLSSLTMIVEPVGGDGRRRILLHAQAGESPVQSLAAHLAVGDEVVVRIVESAELEWDGPDGCSYCRRGVVDVTRIVQGPSAAICDRCLDGFSAAVRDGSTLPLGTVIRTEPTWMCGFCQKRADAMLAVLVRNGAAICPKCLRACVDVQGERDQSEPRGTN